MPKVAASILEAMDRVAKEAAETLGKLLNNNNNNKIVEDDQQLFRKLEVTITHNFRVSHQGLVEEKSLKSQKKKISWKFVYILAKQCRYPFNLTNLSKFELREFEIFSIQNLFGHPEQAIFST